MESTARRPSIDVAPERSWPGLALFLAVLSVPGSTMAWDTLPGGGLVFGAPLAVAALILGLQAHRRSRAGRGKALAAILIAGAMLAMMVVWAIAESV
jgi:hypothetical protein